MLLKTINEVRLIVWDLRSIGRTKCFKTSSFNESGKNPNRPYRADSFWCIYWILEWKTSQLILVAIFPESQPQYLQKYLQIFEDLVSSDRQRQSLAVLSEFPNLSELILISAKLELQSPVFQGIYFYIALKTDIHNVWESDSQQCQHATMTLSAGLMTEMSKIFWNLKLFISTSLCSKVVGR